MTSKSQRLVSSIANCQAGLGVALFFVRANRGSRSLWVPGWSGEHDELCSITQNVSPKSDVFILTKSQIRFRESRGVKSTVSKELTWGYLFGQDWGYRQLCRLVTLLMRELNWAQDVHIQSLGSWELWILTEVRMNLRNCKPWRSELNPMRSEAIRISDGSSLPWLLPRPSVCSSSNGA